jgi:SAM-dependent methyltransferase
MENDEQVAAYAAAGRIDGVMAAAYLFHTAHVTEVIQGCRQVVDLGCGPATQLAQIAQFNPETEFSGIDLSEPMLEKARAYVAELGLRNVTFSRGDVTRLDSLPDRSADGVISMMTFHHLRTREHLSRCFQEIRRVLKPGGALYLVDFGRLKSLKSVNFFAYMNAAHQPRLVSLDYERSLRAAFPFEDFKALGAEELGPGARVYRTFLVPLLTLIQTGAKPISTELRGRLRAMRRALPRRYRADLDDMRLFFRLGGLPSDAFR